MRAFVSDRYGSPDVEGAHRGRQGHAGHRTYPFAEIPEAIRYLEGGHAAGKVVITV